MGADFIWAIAPIDLDQNAYIDKANAMTLEDAQSLFNEVEHIFYDLDGEADDEAFRLAVIARTIEAINACYKPSRELDTLTLKGSKYVLTGGMSWGDVPTDVFDDVCLLASFDYLLDGKDN